jgi:ABC-type sulfate transport system permease component
VSTYYFKWWPPILGAVLLVYHFLGERTPIFNWLLGLFILMATLLLAIIVVAIVRQKRAQTWRSYTKDTFDGLVWRWTTSL